jgi:uncharacterized protein
MGIGENNQMGVGVGYRPEFAPAFFSDAPPDLSWIEVVTENFLPENGRDTIYLQNLRRLRARFPVALHGVSLNLGSTDPLSDLYLSQLAWLEREIEPWIVSDHLCWTGVGGKNLFDLLPLPYSGQAFALVAEKIERVQERLRRPLILENITYYGQPVGGEMPEEDFLNGLCARTGCRLLLDLNNVYVNSVNHGFDPSLYLRNLRLENVAQVHLAGFERGASGLLVDTHGTPVCEEVWALYAWLQARTGALPAMIERDDNIPDWAGMAPEIERLRRMQAKGKEHARGFTPMAVSGA